MKISGEFRLVERLDSEVVRPITVTIDGQSVPAFDGESVLSVLLSQGERGICKNSHGLVSGAYCGMGICFCCLVRVDGREKQRACMTAVADGMEVETRRSLSDLDACLVNEHEVAA